MGESTELTSTQQSELKRSSFHAHALNESTINQGSSSAGQNVAIAEDSGKIQKVIFDTSRPRKTDETDSIRSEGHACMRGFR